MNVNDFKGPSEYPPNLLKDIFEKQHELATKYLHIEKENGLLQTEDLPVNIHDAKGQARLKDMAWRTTEEIAEALEAYDHGDRVHYREELADAFHFYVEFMLLANYYPTVKGEEEELEACFNRVSSQVFSSPAPFLALDFIKSLGLACNCLKNKPWKQTQMMTDTEKFYDCLNQSFIKFIIFMRAAGFTSRTLYDMYFRKNKVNQFRQESQY